MTQYVGTTVINAKPMNRLEYNIFRGWELPPDENGEDEGYLVEQVNAGKANTTGYVGYVSWTPKEVFDKMYRPNGNFTFGDAIVLCKAGCRIARAGWNGKGMYVFFSKASTSPAYKTKHGTYARQDYLYMKTAQNTLVPWVAAQSDILAEDWYVLED